jgi:hypothetical protein
MVLALAYMKKTGQASPEITERFLEKIDVGYRRLLGFEVEGEPGGFDWWGKPPANLFLTAYGLVEFRDMAEVYPVDPGLVPRIVAFLLAKQGADGSWSPEGVRAAWSTDMGKGKAFNLTAYVAWGLARAGEPSAKALAWLEAHGGDVADPYGLSLAALALLTSDPSSAAGRRLLERLVATATVDTDGTHWAAADETGVGGRGVSAAIETTALAIQALLAGGGHQDLAYRALERLVLWRGPDGRFGTTQSTILALKALLAAEAGGQASASRTLRVRRGKTELPGIDLPAGSTEPRTLPLTGDGPVTVVLEGEGRARATLSRTAWMPWPTLPAPKGGLRLDVTYPGGVLPVDRRAEARVAVRNEGKRRASVVTLEIGIPPGCRVEPEDVQGEGAEHVERGETTIVIYLRHLDPGDARAFTIDFTPSYAIDVRTAPSKAYEYYVPEEEVVVPPLRVRAGPFRPPAPRR